MQQDERVTLLGRAVREASPGEAISIHSIAERSLERLPDVTVRIVPVLADDAEHVRAVVAGRPVTQLPSD